MSEPQTLYLVGKKDAGKRLDRFLQERIPGLSRSRIQQAIRERVTLSWGVEARPATTVMPDGEVRIGYKPIEEEVVDLPLPVLHRGEGWLAVDKPARIPVHPVNAVRENSLIRMLRRQEGVEELRLVHRLDSETSGVLLIADNPDTARVLSTAFERGEVHKEYLALVRGVIEGEQGEIDLPVGGSQDSRVHVRQMAGRGSPARTRWSVERRYQVGTLLRLFPETGRKHQIRVHLEAIGHPVIGDMLYGRPDADYLDMVRGVRDPRKEEGGPLRQLLHCARMVVPAPEGETAVEAGLPEDFLAHLPE
jgi:23S rRNA pseudouridine1911/1915/1917 synthase